MWMLEHVAIVRCKVCKYSGLCFRSISHVKGSSKVTHLCGCPCSILSSHENVNRILFVDSVWTNILPSIFITYGCSVWLGNIIKSKSILKWIQYSMAKIYYAFFALFFLFFFSFFHKICMQNKSIPARTAVFG